MKKLLALLLAMLLVFSLAACGTDNESSGKDKPSETGTEDPGETAKPAKGDNADETPKEDETPEEPDPFGPETLALIASVNEDTAEKTGTCGEDLTWYCLDNVLVIRGTGDMEDYDDNAETPWSDLDSQIELVYLEDGVTSVGEHAFSPLKGMQALYIPDSVTVIRPWACSWCEKLTYVRCSENLTEIGSNALEKTGIQSFSFPHGIARIEDRVFLNSALTSVEIPDSVTEIGKSAFAGCDLTSVTLPDSVTTIEEDAFYFTDITAITIPASVTFMGSAFVNSHMTTVTFLGDAPEMEEHDKLLLGLKEGATIQYSGSGFEPYIETYSQYNWVKQ